MGSALAGKLRFLLRRAVYIKHPSHLPIPVRQKKDWLGVYLSRRDRSASAIRYAKSPSSRFAGEHASARETSVRIAARVRTRSEKLRFSLRALFAVSLGYLSSRRARTHTANALGEASLPATRTVRPCVLSYPASCTRPRIRSSASQCPWSLWHSVVTRRAANALGEAALPATRTVRRGT